MTCPFCGGDFLDGNHELRKGPGVPTLVCPGVPYNTMYFLDPMYAKMIRDANPAR